MSTRPSQRRARRAASDEGRVRCVDGRMHRVWRGADGRWRSSGCSGVHEESRALLAVAKLGMEIEPDRASSCAQIATLCDGLPTCIANGAREVASLGTWKRLYTVFERNGLVISVVRKALLARSSCHSAPEWRGE